MIQPLEIGYDKGHTVYKTFSASLESNFQVFNLDEQVDYAGFRVTRLLHNFRGLCDIIWNLLLVGGDDGHSLCSRQTRHGKPCVLNKRFPLQIGSGI